MKNFVRIPERLKKIDINSPMISEYLSQDIGYTYINVSRIIKINPHENHCIILIDQGSTIEKINCPLKVEQLMTSIRNCSE
jgi:hypothetical protein